MSGISQLTFDVVKCWRMPAPPLVDAQRMDINVGDCVRTSTGKIGTVASISPPTAYVQIKLPSEIGAHLVSVLLSELTKVEARQGSPDQPPRTVNPPLRLIPPLLLPLLAGAREEPADCDFGRWW